MPIHHRSEAEWALTGTHRSQTNTLAPGGHTATVGPPRHRQPATAGRSTARSPLLPGFQRRMDEPRTVVWTVLARGGSGQRQKEPPATYQPHQAARWLRGSRADERHGALAGCKRPVAL